ncbi:zinc-binding alcohol dehydrogenase family protein [Aureimonas sp. AU4]|uniref:zinc-binding alcohol dehydrogenase family protein n=1 Tax=Aureimonas sp. AU4 TaxID=1638163 RepID=UPI00078112B9|nr:zinc-binding alcohol dehydrogenase family protein [Aureimonas sp. AU4]
MRALVCAEPGKLALGERERPGAAREGWALVDVAHVGICGTDYHIFEGKHPFLQYPRVMGHEVSGRVARSARLPEGTPVVINPYVSCGTCAACRKGRFNCCMRIEVLGVHRDGALCERIEVPEGNLIPAGDLPLRDAAMVEFLAIGAHAVRRSQTSEGRALVVGAGPIGLGTALFAKLAGLEVAIMDPLQERLDFATEALGLPEAVVADARRAERVREMTAGDGFEVVFDATGHPASMQAGFADVGHGGSLVLVSVVTGDITFSDPEFHKREMRLVGSRNALAADFEHVMTSIRAGRVPTDRLATHGTTLAEAADRIPHWAHDKKGLVKAIVEVAT